MGIPLSCPKTFPAPSFRAPAQPTQDKNQEGIPATREFLYSSVTYEFEEY